MSLGSSLSFSMAVDRTPTKQPASGTPQMAPPPEIQIPPQTTPLPLIPVASPFEQHVVSALATLSNQQHELVLAVKESFEKMDSRVQAVDVDKRVRYRILHGSFPDVNVLMKKTGRIV